MYVKLAIRNVKKSMKDYLIYMVTLILCVGLFYSFMSICSKYYMSKLPVQYDMNTLQSYMRYPVIAITAVLFFLIQYVNRFILRRKQKEFAIQTMLGMEQRNVAFLFFIETFIMGLIAIILGIIAGTFFSQILTVIIMNSFKEEYRMYFALYPDTAGIVIAVFCAAFIIIGLSNIKTIRKSKIIEMLRADKELQNDMQKEFLMPVMILVMTAVSAYLIRLGLLVYHTYEGKLAAGEVGIFDTITIYSMLILPAVFIGAVVLYIILCIIKKRLLFLRHFTIILAAITILIITFALRVVSGHPAMGSTETIHYFILANVYLIFLMFAFFYSLSQVMQIFKQKSKKWKYKGHFLFLIGQLNGRLTSNSRTMSILSGCILFAVLSFIIDPIMTGWGIGYLDKRAVYDIQISSIFNSKTTLDTLPSGDFSFVEDALKRSEVKLKDAFAVEIYFMDKKDFIHRNEGSLMVMALSDFNHLRTMAGYDEIQLAKDEFTLQWHFAANTALIEKFSAENKTITLNNHTLVQAKNTNYIDSLGEAIYSFNDTYCVAVVPDTVCNGLLMGQCNYYGQIEGKLSYKKTCALSGALEKGIRPSDETGYSTYFRLRTLQRNGGISATLMIKLLVFYGGMVLLIIGFTILSLQQLADSSDFRQRFIIIKKLGVTDASINRLILGQMSIWFGLPILFASISALVTGQFYIHWSEAYINLYIGMGNLYCTIFKKLMMVVVLFICYFTSTWVLFKKNVELN